MEISKHYNKEKNNNEMPFTKNFKKFRKKFSFEKIKKKDF